MHPVKAFTLKHSRKIGIILALLIFASTWYVMNQAAGATYTWDDEGGDGLWSTCTNWTSNTCPGAGDIAYFSSTTIANSVVDASFGGSVAGIYIENGFTATVTQQTNLTIGSSDYIQNDGGWVQGTTSFDINGGDFTLSGGLFMTGVGTSTFEGSVDTSGGTLDASSTRAFVFDGSGADSTFTCAGNFGGRADLNKGGSRNFTVGTGCEVNKWDGGLTVGGNITINSGAAARFGSSTISVTGLVVSGTTTASSTLSVSSITLNGTGSFEYSGDTIYITGNYTDNGADFDETGITFVFQGNFNTLDSVLTCSGTFDGLVDIAKTDAGADFTLAGTCDVTTVGVVNSAGNVYVNANNTLRFGTSTTLGGLLISGTTTASTSLNINAAFAGLGDFYLYSGSTFDFDGSTMNVEGDVNISASASADFTNITIVIDGTVTYDDTVFTCSGTFDGLVDIAKTDAGADFTLASGCSVTGTTTTSSGPITINGTWDANGTTLTASVLTVGSAGRLILISTETLTSPSLSSGSTVEYKGTGTYSSLNAGADYHHLEFTGGGTYNISSAVTVAGDFTSTNDSNFNHTGDSFTFDGTGNQTVTGTSTFTGFTKNVTSTSTLLFGANQTQTFLTTLTLTGSSTGSGNLILKSTATGTEYYLDMQGPRTLEYLTVSDSNNTDSYAAYCDPGCADGTGNTNWSFGPDPYGGAIVWDGGGSDEHWSTCANWIYDICPDSTQDAYFDNTSTKDSVIDISFRGGVKGLNIASGYTGSITASSAIAVGVTGFSQEDGVFVAPTSTFATHNFSHTGGTFTDNGGTVMFGTSSVATTSAGTNFTNISIGGGSYSELNDNRGVWRLNESTAAATVADHSENGFTGSSLGSSGANNLPQPTNNVAPVQYPNLYARSFDGTDDYISFGDVANDVKAPATISAWVKPGFVNNDPIIATESGTGWYAGIMVHVQSGGKLYTFTGDATGGASGDRRESESVSTIPNDGEWHHVAVVVNTASDIDYYIDGVDAGYQYLSGTAVNINSFSRSVTIGADLRTSNYFDGDIDEVYLYRRALSVSEVEMLSDGELVGPIEGAVTFAGTTVDVAGNLEIGENSTLDTSTTGCSGASCNIEVAGDWINYGTFTPRSSTVTLDGANQSIIGTTTFYNLTKSVTSADTLTFPATSTQYITGLLTLKGISSNLLSLVSSVPTNPWRIFASGSQSLQFLSVTDSTNIDTALLSPSNSTDGGNNTNWYFYTPPVGDGSTGGFFIKKGVKFLGDTFFR